MRAFLMLHVYGMPIAYQYGLWEINTDGTGLTRLPSGSLGLPVFAPEGNTYVMPLNL